MRRLSLRQLANYILHGDAHLSPVDGHPGHPIVRFSGVQGTNPFGLSLDDLYRERVARNEQEDREDQIRDIRKKNDERAAAFRKKWVDREELGRKRIAEQELEAATFDWGTPLNHLNLTPAPLNALKRGHIRTIEHLDSKPQEEIKWVRNIGTSHSAAIIHALNVWYCRFPQPNKYITPLQLPEWKEDAPPVLQRPVATPPVKTTFEDQPTAAEKVVRAIFGHRPNFYIEWEGYYPDINGHTLEEYLAFLLDSTMSEREAIVIRARFGLVTGRSQDLQGVGRLLGVTRERIRQIEAKALRKLRAPVRSQYLRPFFYELNEADEEACNLRHSIYLKLGAHYRGGSLIPNLIAHQLQRKALAQVEQLIDETDWKEINRIAHYGCTVVEELPKVCALCEEPTLPPFEWCIIHIKTGGKLFPLICDGCGIQFTRRVVQQTGFTRSYGRTQKKVFHNKACMSANIGDLLRGVPRAGRRTRDIECPYCKAVPGENCKTITKGKTAGRYVKKLHPIRSLVLCASR